MRKEDEIVQQICEVAGIEMGNLNGTPVWFSVKEMREKDGYSSWRTRPSGRYQINVGVPGERRERIFRTKVKDGSYDILGVVDAIKTQARIHKYQKECELARQSNRDAAELIREDIKLKHTYVSGYASSPNTFCAPATTEGKVAVQVYFGNVDPETAVKIFQFAQSLER